MVNCRYFLEVFYKGSNYSGFQIQQNANSIQAEVEKAFGIIQQSKVSLTGASRTDTGVHALQNYFHFDFEGQLHPQFVYKMNAVLPPDIGIKNCYPVSEDAHCRYDAVAREYKYYIYQTKDPFLRDRAYYFPYHLNIESLVTSARILKEYTDFSSFSKRNSQVKNFLCRIDNSEWEIRKDMLIYHVRANRFLRGMVRGLTGTMLQVGRAKISLDDFRKIILSGDCTKANFAVPAQGLFLTRVEYATGFFNRI